MTVSTASPTLSEIHGWDADHLEVAADVWKARAQAWESSYAVIFEQTSRLGETAWQGAAADAAAQRIGADRRVILAAADLLNETAAIARAGAAEIRTAKQIALDKVTAARGAGFDVEDDLSIVDVTASSPTMWQHREAQAMEHARNIWKAADTLVATDASVARRMAEAVNGLGDMTFPTEPGQQWPHVLLADYAGVIGRLPEAPHLIYCYPSARPDFWWCEGYDVGGGPYGFDSPIDVSGVG